MGFAQVRQFVGRLTDHRTLASDVEAELWQSAFDLLVCLASPQSVLSKHQREVPSAAPNPLKSAIKTVGPLGRSPANVPAR